VAAPFGSAVVTGLVADLDPPPAPPGTAERDVVAFLEDEPFLPPTLVRVLVRAAAYYVVAPGEMLRAAVPGRLLGGSEAVYAPGNAAVGASPGGTAGAVLALLLERGEARLPELVEAVGRKGLASALKDLVARGLVRIRSENLRAAAAPSDRAWVARPASADHPAFARAPKRRALHAHLVALGRPASPRSCAPQEGRPRSSRLSRRRASSPPSRRSGAWTSRGTSALPERTAAPSRRPPKRRPSRRSPLPSRRAKRANSFWTA
jgi:primosomal protein N'